MELRHYFAILRRSWPLVVGLPLLVALATIAAAFLLPAQYATQVTMFVTQKPLATNQPSVVLPDYNNFNSWAASEYIVDDMLQLVETQTFAQDITAWARQQHNLDLDPDLISEGLSAERKHRAVTVSIEAATKEQAEIIAQGVVAMLQEKGLAYWNRNDSGQLSIAVLDAPEEASRAGGLVGLALDVVIRTLLAFLLAVGLAFLRHYLDQTVRRRADVEALGLEVVGAIPLAKGRLG
jgi:capsular polysaccharide biosynthesis protein